MAIFPKYPPNFGGPMTTVYVDEYGTVRPVTPATAVPYTEMRIMNGVPAFDLYEPGIVIPADPSASRALRLNSRGELERVPEKQPCAYCAAHIVGVGQECVGCGAERTE